MALDLTARTLRSLKELTIEPNIIVKFEGLDVLISANRVKDFITIACPGFFIGAEGFFIGGLKEIEPERNKALIDDKTTTYSIKQQINHDEGKSSSISSMNLGFVDKDQFITKLITPGELLPDVLGRKVQVFVTFGNVSFFEDSIEIFKGFTTTIDSGAGNVVLRVNHPDNKKKVSLFKKPSTTLVAGINATDTVLVLDDASELVEPSGNVQTYLRIGSELIEYSTITGNTISGLVRGVLGSGPLPHAAEDQVTAVYSFEGNPLDIALQIMMSGHGTDPVHSGINISSFVQIGSGVNQIPNAVYFDQINVIQDYGIRAGDNVTITGATNAGNNVSNAVVESVVRFNSGYYVVLSGVSLVLENVTSATMDTFSQYNVLPDGMKMTPDEVDIDEHIRIRDFFHSASDMRFYLKDDNIEGKEFIEKQLYRPIACYSLPRKAQASVGYTVGPIPGENISTLDITTVKDPKNVRIVRTQARSFFNEVFYKYDDTPLAEDEKFTTGKLFISQDSKNRIPGINRQFTIESQGLRSDLNANIISTVNANRILDRYKFGGEIVHCKALMRESVEIEIGDIIIGDFTELQVTDITRGDRLFKPRLFEVLNKTLNLKTGDVSFELLDTGLNIDTRFGLMSPCSLIAGVINQQQFVIGPDAMYPSKFGNDEFRKWEKIVNIANPISVNIHNGDYSISEDLVVTNISENTFTLDVPATITLTAGLMVDFTGYEDTDTSDRQKLIYGYMNDNATFTDGENQYSMI